MVEPADSNKTGPYPRQKKGKKDMQGYDKRRKSSGRSKVGHELLKRSDQHMGFRTFISV